MIFHILFSNIKKDTKRFLLMIGCLAISIGMLLATLSIICYLKSGYESSERSYWGTCDIIVQTEKLDDDMRVKNLAEYMIYSKEVPVECKSGKKMVRAFHFNDLNKIGIKVNMNAKEVEDGLVVSNSFLKEEHVDIGDEIDLQTGSVKNKGKIVGTFTCTNELAHSTLDNCLFTTLEGMDEVSKTYQNECLIKMADEKENELDYLCNYLEGKYGVNKVKLAFDEDEFATKYDGLFAILLLVSITMSMMCINIVYSIKKFIITLDAKQYAILRGIGGNSRYIISILGAEAVILGGVSAIISIIVSRVFIWGMVKFFVEDLSAKSIGFNPILVPGVLVTNIILMITLNVLASRSIRKNCIKETYMKVTHKGDIGEVVKEINSILELEEGKVYGREAYIDFLLKSSRQLYNIIYYLSIIPLIMSLIISVTNAIFTFYENKRDLFILKSLGMSEKKVKKMYFLEQFLSSMVGAIIGILFGSLLIAQSKWYMVLTKNSMAINQSLVVTLLVFITTIVFSGIVAKIVVERIINGKLVSEVRN